MDHWTIILALIMGLLAIYYFFIWENPFLKHGIPHKTPLFGLGNLGGVLLRRYPYTDQLVNVYRLNEDAKYVGFYDFNFPVLMIRDLELIKSITIKHFDHFMNHRHLSDPDIDPLVANNLFSLHGDEWRAVRNLLTPAFTSSKMKAMFKLILECAETFSNSLQEQCASKSKQYDARDIFSRYANDMIGTCAFGITVDSMKYPNNEFYESGKRATHLEGLRGLKYFATRSLPTLTKIFGIKLIDVGLENFLCKLIGDTIATREKQGIIRPDMIQLLMEARNHKHDANTPELTIECITSQVLKFFVAGFDTTSLTMCFVAHQLAIYPEIRKKVQNEIDQVMESCNGELTYEAVNNMEYLDAVINETLRMYPATVFTDRVCTKCFELPPTLPGTKPIMLKPGDNIWVPVWAMHHDPKYFPRPDEFDPERFIGGAEANSNLHAYLPFGIGPRMCIGNRFALLETKVLFLYLLTKFDISLGNKMISPLRLSKATLTVVPEGGFWLNLKPKNISN